MPMAKDDVLLFLTEFSDSLCMFEAALDVPCGATSVSSVALQRHVMRGVVDAVLESSRRKRKPNPRTLCMHVCTYIYIHSKCTKTNPVCMCVCMYVCMCDNMQPRRYDHVPMHFLCACACACMHVCVHTHQVH